MFIKRNADGHIIAVSRIRGDGFEESLQDHSEELAEFASELSTAPAAARKMLQESDTDLARVLEDVIDLLTLKGVIQFTELPEAAQHKLLARKKIRQDARNLNLLDEGGEDLILP